MEFIFRSRGTRGTRAASHTSQRMSLLETGWLVQFFFLFYFILQWEKVPLTAHLFLMFHFPILFILAPFGRARISIHRAMLLTLMNRARIQLWIITRMRATVAHVKKSLEEQMAEKLEIFISDSAKNDTNTYFFSYIWKHYWQNRKTINTFKLIKMKNS